MDREKLAAAFNLWIERYIENPEQFEREFQAVSTFNAEKGIGVESSYGADCAAYLLSLMAEAEKVG